MELVSEAIAFAVKAHDGMRRKKSEAPYILHPMEAAVIVGTMTDDQHVIAAAALHDVVEDTAVTLDELSKIFPKEVTDAVALMTHNDNTPYWEYVAKIKENPIARAVKLADLLHNSDKTRLEDQNANAADLKRWEEKYSKALTILR